jgi:1-acyl-sn-glycerol-3-phosphate acyltransferase
MMRWIQHLAFYFFVFLWTCILSLGVFFLWLPQKWIFYYARFWSSGVISASKLFLKITVRVHGKENLPQNGCFILASKHQSAWETLFFQTVLENPVIFLKKKLLYIPVIGLFLWRLGVIPVSPPCKKNFRKIRSQREDALLKCREQSRPLIIFPEGTRTAVGQRKSYQPGVYAAAKVLDARVVPCALNSGKVWPPKNFFKTPGTIDVYFLPPLFVVEDVRCFMQNLEAQIELFST